MNRRMFVATAGALSLALMLTACGQSSSPASPSPSSSSSSTSSQPGATISGSVSGSTTGNAASYQKLGTGNGITVTIAGSNLTVSVDNQGKFTFTGVQAGTVQLVFTGGGGTATVTLNGVQETDKITIQVTLKGTTATLDTEQRNGATVTELEDQITAINPGGTTRTLDVGSTRVSVPATAVMRHGDTAVDFAALRVGDRVHVRGAMNGAMMVATEVMVQNTNASTGMNASGTVSSLQKIGAGCPTIQFMMGGWTVETNASTDFQKGSCSTVANGMSVHVKGDVQQPSGRVLATWVQVK
jgi:hypothetical protein